MRFTLGILSGVLGALAGWFGLAFLVISLAGPDRDGGIAMGAFFNIGPIGGLAGFVAGIWLFTKIGFVRDRAPSPDAEKPDAAPETKIETKLETGPETQPETKLDSGTTPDQGKTE